jgi:hypothetical protein
LTTESKYLEDEVTVVKWRVTKGGMLTDGRHTEREVVSGCLGCTYEVKSPLGQYLECSLVECPDNQWGKDKTCEHFEGSHDYFEKLVKEHDASLYENPSFRASQEILKQIATKNRERLRLFLEARGLKTYGSIYSKVYEEWETKEIWRHLVAMDMV